MKQECSPACGTCDQLHYETRCPWDEQQFPNIWQSGDLDRTFERLMTTFPNVQVWSRPTYAPGDAPNDMVPYTLGPWLITLDDFLTPDEMQSLIEWGSQLGYERSEEAGGIDETTGEEREGEISDDRTSTNAWCNDDCKENDMVVDIFSRIEQLTGVPRDHSESLQLLKCKVLMWLLMLLCTSRMCFISLLLCCESVDGLKKKKFETHLSILFRRPSTTTTTKKTNPYAFCFADEVGQFYLTHHDYVIGSDKELGGPRILTAFMYLSDVEEGGETRFDWADNLVVKPKAGRLALWPSVLNDDPSQIDERTQHEAMPVVRGTKYGANAWLHLRNWDTASEMGC